MCDSLAKSIILATANSLVPLAKTGRPRVSHELLLDQFIRVLRTGTTWRDVKGIDFRTAHRHFIRWAREGIFEAAFRRLHTLARRRRRDGSYLALDTSFVKNVFGIDAVGRNRTDRGRKATKIVALVDDQGLPHKLGFIPANISDYRVLPSVTPFPRSERGNRVYADKGFDSSAIREEIRKEGFVPRVARRRTVTTVWADRRRRVVERFFGILDKCRRLILRYDKTIVAYEGWTWLACCRLAGGRASSLRRAGGRSGAL